eukprot:15349798-Ditylum_brightwellii.AAC.1
MDCLVFFEYYDGYMTKGMISFDTKIVTSAGSTKHCASRQIFQMLFTKNQFCSKDKMVALLTKAIIEDGDHQSDVNAL